MDHEHPPLSPTATSTSCSPCSESSLGVVAAMPSVSDRKAIVGCLAAVLASMHTYDIKEEGDEEHFFSAYEAHCSVHPQFEDRNGGIDQSQSPAAVIAAAGRKAAAAAGSAAPTRKVIGDGDVVDVGADAALMPIHPSSDGTNSLSPTTTDASPGLSRTNSSESTSNRIEEPSSVTTTTHTPSSSSSSTVITVRHNRGPKLTSNNPKQTSVLALSRKKKKNLALDRYKRRKYETKLDLLRWATRIMMLEEAEATALTPILMPLITMETDKDDEDSPMAASDEIIQPFLHSLSSGRAGFQCVALLLFNFLLLSSTIGKEGNANANNFVGYDARVRQAFKRVAVAVFSHDLMMDYMASIKAKCEAVEAKCLGVSGEKAEDGSESVSGSCSRRSSSSEEDNKSKKSDNDATSETKDKSADKVPSSECSVSSKKSTSSNSTTSDKTNQSKSSKEKSDDDRLILSDQAEAEALALQTNSITKMSQVEAAAVRKFEMLEHAIAVKLLALSALLAKKQAAEKKNGIGRGGVVNSLRGGSGGSGQLQRQGSEGMVWQPRTATTPREKLLRAAKICSAGVVAGAIFGLSGGLAAPGIAATIATVAGSAAAATAAVVTLTSTIAMSTVFGVGGGGLVINKMTKRTKGLQEFSFRRELRCPKPDEQEKLQTHKRKSKKKDTAELSRTVCISGWLRDGHDFQRPWGVLPENLPKLEMLQRFYSLYDADKVPRCALILDKYKGNEDKLWELLRETHGKDPDTLLPFDGPLQSAALTDSEKGAVDELMDALGYGELNKSSLNPPSPDRTESLPPPSQSSSSGRLSPALLQMLEEGREAGRVLQRSRENSASKVTNNSHEDSSEEEYAPVWEDRIKSFASEESMSQSEPPKTLKPSTSFLSLSTASSDSPSTVTTPVSTALTPVTSPTTVVSSSSTVNGTKDQEELPAHLRCLWDYHSKYGGELYTAQWESELLHKLTGTMMSIGQEFASSATLKALEETALAALASALSLPSNLLRVAKIIDGPWALAVKRADEAGVELARSLMESKEAGHRPVTLVGFSLGARIIYSCLKQLAIHQEKWEDEREQLKLSSVSSSEEADGSPPCSDSNVDSGKPTEGGTSSGGEDETICTTPSEIDDVGWQASKDQQKGADEASSSKRNRFSWGSKQRSRGSVSKTTSSAQSQSSPPRATSKTEKKLSYAREPASIIEDAILIGCPAYVNLHSWAACRRIVAGRLVNCYYPKDLVLSLMFQYECLTGLMRPTCGTHAVQLSGVENYDVSKFVSVHSDYCLEMENILSFVKFGQPEMLLKTSDYLPKSLFAETLPPDSDEPEEKVDNEADAGKSEKENCNEQLQVADAEEGTEGECDEEASSCGDTKLVPAKAESVTFQQKDAEEEKSDGEKGERAIKNADGKGKSDDTGPEEDGTSDIDEFMSGQVKESTGNAPAEEFDSIVLD